MECGSQQQYKQIKKEIKLMSRHFYKKDWEYVKHNIIKRILSKYQDEKDV